MVKALCGITVPAPSTLKLPPVWRANAPIDDADRCKACADRRALRDSVTWVSWRGAREWTRYHAVSRDRYVATVGVPEPPAAVPPMRVHAQVTMEAPADRIGDFVNKVRTAVESAGGRFEIEGFDLLWKGQSHPILHKKG